MKKNKWEIYGVLFGITQVIHEEFKNCEEEKERLENIIKEQEQVIAVLKNRLESKENK